MSKQEIINNIRRTIAALNTVPVMPGRDNYLNQGGAIAMLEGTCDQIEQFLMDKPNDDANDDASEPVT